LQVSLAVVPQVTTPRLQICSNPPFHFTSFHQLLRGFSHLAPFSSPNYGIFSSLFSPLPTERPPFERRSFAEGPPPLFNSASLLQMFLDDIFFSRMYICSVEICAHGPPFSFFFFFLTGSIASSQPLPPLSLDIFTAFQSSWTIGKFFSHLYISFPRDSEGAPLPGTLQVPLRPLSGDNGWPLGFFFLHYLPPLLLLRVLPLFLSRERSIGFREFPPPFSSISIRPVGASLSGLFFASRPSCPSHQTKRLFFNALLLPS